MMRMRPLRYYDTYSDYDGVPTFMQKGRTGDELYTERGCRLGLWITDDIVITWISPHNAVGFALQKYHQAHKTWLNIKDGDPIPTEDEVRFMVATKGITDG